MILSAPSALIQVPLFGKKYSFLKFHVGMMTNLNEMDDELVDNSGLNVHRLVVRCMS